jgi:hypothetical protein
MENFINGNPFCYDEWLKIKAYMRVYMYHTNQILVMGFNVRRGHAQNSDLNIK